MRGTKEIHQNERKKMSIQKNNCRKGMSTNRLNIGDTTFHVTYCAAKVGDFGHVRTITR